MGGFNLLLLLIINISTSYSYHQKWQIVTPAQLGLILNGSEGQDPEIFYQAADLLEIGGLCEQFGVKIPEDNRNYTQEIAIQECKDFFTHRKQAQQWMNDLFELIPHYGLNLATSASLKSWFWAIDSLANNSISEAFACWQLEKFQYPLPRETWLKFDKAFNEVLVVWPNMGNFVGITTQEIWSIDAERRKRFIGYGFQDISAICEPKPQTKKK